MAKGISNVETDPNVANFPDEVPADLNNRFNMAYWRGPMVGIPYQRFITDFVWDLPFGKGRVEVDDDGESPAEGGRDASSAA